jgi:hypothetical protein
MRSIWSLIGVDAYTFNAFELRKTCVERCYFELSLVLEEKLVERETEVALMLFKRPK